MIDRYGVRGNEVGGAFFMESAIPGARSISTVRCEISRQNANLTLVKEYLARQARAVGANAIANFQYGQKAHSLLDQVLSFKWDTESWHGAGDAVRAECLYHAIRH